MIEKKLSRTDFIKYLQDNVKNKDLPVYMDMQPVKGWNFHISAQITDIVDESERYDIAFVSNAFSDIKQNMNTNDIIARLNELDNCGYIAFEIYGCNGTTNEQIEIHTPNTVTVSESDKFITINIFLDKI